MQKKLLAVAVAGALFAPVAFAQTAVTISGYVKVGPDYVSYTGMTGPTGITAAGTQVTRTQSNEWRVTDHSSRIIFNVSEDLGSGLSAIAQVDTRFNPADVAHPSSQGYPGAVGGGNTWVGLRSSSWGTLTFGRHDLHYGKAGDDTANKAGSLLLISSSIFDVVGKPTAATANSVATTTGVAMAGQTRTNNVIRWDSPNWSGFALTLAYSTNPLQPGGGGQNVEGDLHLGTSAGVAGAATSTCVAGAGPNAGTFICRRGRGYNFNPSYTAANWGIQYSLWDAKQDTNSTSSLTFTNNFSLTAVGAANIAPNAIGDDQKSQVLSGYVRFGDFKVGLAWNSSKTTSVSTGLVNGDRSAWAIPVTWTSGAHSIAGHYTRANNSKDVTTAAGATLSGSDTGASMWALAYDYSLSKRTSVGVSYGEIRNKSNAAYNFFYNSQTAFGSASTGALAGEKIRLFSTAIRHNF
jgi:predicted porin